MPTVVETAEVIGKVAGAILAVGGVVAVVARGVKWIGTSVSTFFDEKMLPPITKLTESVDVLAERTHENTESINHFVQEQSAVNLKTARDIAEIHGRLRMDT